jgi:hypothetical protein
LHAIPFEKHMYPGSHVQSAANPLPAGLELKSGHLRHAAPRS